MPAVLPAAHAVFAFHCWRMVRGPAPVRATPPFHEAQPILFEEAAP